MTLVPMKFKGVSWHHNPKELKFEFAKAVNELKAAYKGAYIQNMGLKNMKVSGCGELYGNDCLQQFHRLLALFRQGGSGVLSLPDMPSFYAVFESLQIKGEPKPDVLTYSFVFREVMEEKMLIQHSSHIMRYGETLWDISYIYDIPIDSLVRLNPELKRPDESLEGFTVILC